MIHFISNQKSLYSEYNNFTIEQAYEYLKDKKVLAIDTETSGLDFFTKKLLLFQIGDFDNQFVIDVRDTDISIFNDILKSKEILKIFHNVKFDYKFLKKYGFEIENIYDTMLAEVVLTNGQNKPFDLGALTKRYLDITLDKEEQSKFTSVGYKDFSLAQITYGANDIKYLIKIREKQLEELKKFELENVADLENKVSLAFADIEYNGMNFNSKRWLKNATLKEKELKEQSNKLDKFILDNPKLSKFIKEAIQLDIFAAYSTLRKVDVEWNSPKQVLEVFKEYGLPVNSVNATELFAYNNDEFVKEYLKYKQLEKIVSTYGKSFLKYMDKDGKVRTSFWQILATGRVSSGSKKTLSPNMQNIPADNTYRNCFYASEGNSILSTDYSSQELGIIAQGSKDPVWLKALHNGYDLHSITAELVYGDKWKSVAEDDCEYYKSKSKCKCKEHKKLRQNVKAINFGLAFGMTEHKLSDKLQITIEEAKDLINRYFSVFPNIHKFLNNLGNYGLMKGHIKTFAPYKRIRWFSEWIPKLATTNVWSLSKYERKLQGSISRESKNTPIQGSGANITKLAMVKVRDYINNNNLQDKVKLISQVHDEISTEVDNKFVSQWQPIQEKLMVEASKEIITEFVMGIESTLDTVWKK